MNAPDTPYHPVPTASDLAPIAGFDRVAWCYDWLATLVFGPALRRAQQLALTGLPARAPHVLVLGGGTGWVLDEIWRRRPEATVLYLDASAAMLARAGLRLRHWPAEHAKRVTFRQGTQAALRPDETFDAIITFFVLDCVPLHELPGALGQLLAARRPGAPWLLADFRPARHWWQRGLLRAMYLFFRWSTGLRVSQMADFEAELFTRGLQATARRTYFGGAVAGGIFNAQPNNNNSVKVH